VSRDELRKTYAEGVNVRGGGPLAPVLYYFWRHVRGSARLGLERAIRPTANVEIYYYWISTLVEKDVLRLDIAVYYSRVVDMRKDFSNCGADLHGANDRKIIRYQISK
jgi:hypothetical protein